MTIPDLAVWAVEVTERREEEMQVERNENGSCYRDDAGHVLAASYTEKGRWYAADAEGDDLPSGWRCSSREAADLVARNHAERLLSR